MPLQNRVTPLGAITRVKDRGLFMGNRGGRIHDPVTKTLLNRRWASRRWICCVTKFKDRQRKVMGNSYTELFFLDEVTALAAGHRPCFECRRSDAIDFSAAWRHAFGLQQPPSADDMDLVLHRERVISGLAPQPDSNWLGLPDGAVICSDNNICAVNSGKLLCWSPGGYKLFDGEFREINLITPPAIIAVLQNGYQPRWHQSADQPA